MSDLSQRGLERALSTYSRPTTIGDWVVGSGASTTSVPVTQTDGSAVSLSINVISDLTGSMIVFLSPGANAGTYRHVTNATTSGTLTLDAALDQTPAQGDPFAILRLMSVDITGSENLKQWGGAALEAADSNGVPKQQQAYTEGAAGSAVPASTLQVGGSDGTDLRTLDTDSSGRPNVNVSQAQGAPGSATPAQSLQVGGSDGTDLRALSTDATGAVKLAAGTNSVGAVTEASLDDSAQAPGSAVPAKAIQVGGSDGTDLRALSTDATGAVKLAAGTNSIGAVTEASIDGATANTGAATAAAKALQVGGSDGTAVTALKMQSNGSANVNVTNVPDVNEVPVSYAHVTASAVVKSGSGVLKNLVINTPASSGAVSVYDGTSASGTLIAAVAATQVASLTYNVNFTTGIYVAVTGSLDLTVTYQ